jgi:hypothetical protein
MPEKTLGASVDTDTSLYEGFEEYAEDYRSNSEAVREALRVAMEQEEEEPEATEPVADGGQSRLMRWHTTMLSWSARFAALALLLAPLLLFSVPSFVQPLAVVSTGYSVVCTAIALALYYYEQNTVDRGALLPGEAEA